jgi:YHS domain-containing protein
MIGLTRLLLLVLLILFAGRALRQLLAGMTQGLRAGRTPRPPEQGVRMVRDPVCGVFLVPSRALVLQDRGQTRYFCSEKCRAQFHLRGATRSGSTR